LGREISAWRAVRTAWCPAEGSRPEDGDVKGAWPRIVEPWPAPLTHG